MEERYETFTVLIARIGRSIKRIKAEEMAGLELKGPHVSCLYYLWVYGPMPAAELCERCGEDKAAVSRSLDFLEKRHYITCESSGSRRYRSPLELTEEGRRVCQVIGGRIDRIVDEASAGLTDEERRAMYRALAVISRNLDTVRSAEKSAGPVG